MSKSARQISFWNLDFPFLFFWWCDSVFVWQKQARKQIYNYWSSNHVSIISWYWQSWSSAAVKMISDHAGTAPLDWSFPEYSSLYSDQTALLQGTGTMLFFWGGGGGSSFILLGDAHGHRLPFSHWYYLLLCFKWSYFGPGRPVRGVIPLRTPLISILFVSFKVRQWSLLFTSQAS